MYKHACIRSYSVTISISSVTILILSLQCVPSQVLATRSSSCLVLITVQSLALVIMQSEFTVTITVKAYAWHIVLLARNHHTDQLLCSYMIQTHTCQSSGRMQLMMVSLMYRFSQHFYCSLLIQLDKNLHTLPHKTLLDKFWINQLLLYYCSLLTYFRTSG